MQLNQRLPPNPAIFSKPYSLNAPANASFDQKSQRNSAFITYKTEPVKEISYETRAVKGISYVQVPIYEETEINQQNYCEELPLLLLQLKEKEIELESLKSRVFKDSAPAFSLNFTENREQSAILLELQQGQQRLLEENRALWQENQDLLDQISEMKSRVKKAGAPREDFSPKVKELEAQLLEKSRLLSVLQEKLDKTPHFEQIIRVLKEEIARLSALLDQKIKENGKLAIDYDQLSFKFMEMERNHAFFLEKIKVLEAEREELRAERGEILEFAAKCKENEEKINILSRENQSKSLEIQTLTVKTQISGQLQEETRRLSEELQRKIMEIELISTEKRDFQENAEKYNAALQEIEQSKEKLMFYENKIAILSGEVTKFKGLISGKTTENDDFRIKIENYESSISMMQSELGKYEVIIRELTEKNVNLLAVAVLNCAEIDGLRNRWVEK